jgi:hypothetical protein
MWPVRDLGAFLHGEWRLFRRIRDLRTGLHGRLEGRASVTAAASELRLEESGRLVFGSHVSDASQHYRIVLGDGGAQVFRADGSHFHDLDLSSGAARILHHCSDDIYRGRYRVTGEDHFVVAWRVAGPRKHYRMATAYARLMP